jgi:hypothetical protein
VVFGGEFISSAAVVFQETDQLRAYHKAEHNRRYNNSPGNRSRSAR